MHANRPSEAAPSEPRHHLLRGTTPWREVIEWSLAASLYFADQYLLDDLEPWPAKSLLDTQYKEWGEGESREGQVGGKVFYIAGPTLTLGLLMLPNERGWLNETSYRHVKGFIESTLAVTPVLTTLAKLSTGKERPYYQQKVREGEPLDANDRMSFWSGHASTAFSMATYLDLFLLGNVATDDARHLLWKVPVAAGSLSVASWIAATRVQDHRHDVLDVTVGAAVGATISTLIYGVHQNWFGHFYDDGDAPAATASTTPRLVVVPQLDGVVLVHRF